MYKARQRYLVRAEVTGSERLAAVADEALLGEPVRRRINRLERAAETYWGKVVHRSEYWVLASFETATAAVLGACEMQKRCALIPQISGVRLNVRIGIHPARIDQMPGDAAAVEAVSMGLANLLDEGGIVVSGPVYSAMTPALRQKARRMVGLPTYAIDWQGGISQPTSAISNAADGGAAGKPAGPTIVLRHGGREIRLDSGQPGITVGRDGSNDIVIDDPKASRCHCRITRHLDSYVLVDVSTNGTYITPSEGAPLKIKHELLPLRGKGWITLGIPYRRNLLHRIEFEADHHEICDHPG